MVHLYGIRSTRYDTCIFYFILVYKVDNGFVFVFNPSTFEGRPQRRASSQHPNCTRMLKASCGAVLESRDYPVAHEPGATKRL